MFNFYKLIDIYAEANNLDKAAVLELWYRGNITAEDLLNAYLEDEGIFGYTDTLVRIIKTLAFQSIRDGHDDPWKF